MENVEKKEKRYTPHFCEEIRRKRILFGLFAHLILYTIFT